jgi:hypothetical protein
MSHHLDSPLARQDVRLDITDLYVFRGETGTAFVINVCHSIAEDVPVPGYHPEGMYEFKVDLDGDAVEDVTYRFTFGERGGDGVQSVELRRLTGPEATDPHAGGTVVARGSTEQAISGSDGTRAWTGRAGDPFWIEPDVLHAVGHAFQDGTKIELGDWTPDQATNFFAGQTVERDVHGRVEHAGQLGDRQGVDHLRAASRVPVRAGGRPRARRRLSTSASRPLLERKEP